MPPVRDWNLICFKTSSLWLVGMVGESQQGLRHLRTIKKVAWGDVPIRDCDALKSVNAIETGEKKAGMLHS
jgi:hypothetical protein